MQAALRAAPSRPAHAISGSRNSRMVTKTEKEAHAIRRRAMGPRGPASLVPVPRCCRAVGPTGTAACLSFGGRQEASHCKVQVVVLRAARVKLGGTDRARVAAGQVGGYGHLMATVAAQDGFGGRLL